MQVNALNGRIFCTTLAIGLLSAGMLFAQKPNTQTRAKGSDGGAVARGKYLVEGVARCGQCHTPHDADGNSDRSHSLQGAAVRWNPAKPDPNWPLTAPRIGGTPLPASDTDMVKLLTTGIWTTGAPLRAPMPQFRMNRADAEAVVAYLKSLNPQQ
ncbi:MAG TPA: c-type cytochrome [Candidatus Sulfotelmatobacter sp.]|jgi:mono/diheme cytochrome c family protein|nr:c-type cytochrome [Candidatus Sulfotelmatobacter sp.]